MRRFFRIRWLIIEVGAVILALLIFLIVFFMAAPGTPLSSSGNQTHIAGHRPLAGALTPTNGTSQVEIPAHTNTPTVSGIHPMQLSSDIYSGDGSQHHTEVEPGAFAYASTMVTAFQVGRFSDRGSSNIGWATSTDGGATWQHGFLPGTTRAAGGIYDRITDPTVAYDAAHHTWIIATIAFQATRSGMLAPAMLASLSTDGGMRWNTPVTIVNVGSAGYLDKDWIVCDDTASSPYYGHCYAEWDNYARNTLIQMSVSTDGGRTWTAPRGTVNYASGFDGEPLVQPNGTVIVPLSNASQTAVMAFTSHDGGASWSRPLYIASVTSFAANAYLRDNILLTAGMDGAGKVYLAWVDCRFENACLGNDLVMTTSLDGVSWTPLQRIPIAHVGSGVNYYIPVLGVDRTTSGSAAHLGLVFYAYAANCSSNCNVSVGYVSSANGGTNWSASEQLAPPFSGNWLPAGNNKVGDYISLCFSNGRAFPIFALANAPTGGLLNEAMYTIEGGLG